MSRIIIRGGSWNFVPDHLRSAVRLGDLPVFRSYYLGFRLILRKIV